MAPNRRENGTREPHVRKLRGPSALRLPMLVHMRTVRTYLNQQAVAVGRDLRSCRGRPGHDARQRRLRVARSALTTSSIRYSGRLLSSKPDGSISPRLFQLRIVACDTQATAAASAVEMRECRPSGAYTVNAAPQRRNPQHQTVLRVDGHRGTTGVSVALQRAHSQTGSGSGASAASIKSSTSIRANRPYSAELIVRRHTSHSIESERSSPIVRVTPMWPHDGHGAGSTSRCRVYPSTDLIRPCRSFSSTMLSVAPG